ncbi:MAG: hypothetical protein IT165_19360 [Bryobacterales bacterium]|nr:hypothetical protein [Bryobacterales bacterium]
MDIDFVEHSRRLFHANWTGMPVRLLGVHASNLQAEEGQLNPARRRDPRVLAARLTPPGAA